MGKIKEWYRSIPIWLAIFLFAVVALNAASFVSSKVTGAANAANSQLERKYMTKVLYSDLDSYTGWDAEKTSGSVVALVTVTIEQLLSFDNYTAEDLRTYHTNQFIAQYAPVFIYSISLLTAVLLFYFSKLKKPLALLLKASAKIAENEFDFSMEYSGHDEMAQLCAAFEKMRSALDESNRRMHQMIEERKQLNDAYTHDIRTPIAVLKGYTGILTKFLPAGQLSQEKVIATVNTMEAHVERLEQFANSMNTAQKLADVVIRREPICTEEFVSSLQETAVLLCEKNRLSFELESRIETGLLYIDPSAVTQVVENLLSNATRFAKTKVTVRFEADGKALNICVADDGKGFTGRALLNGTKPYFSGEQTEETYHFGLGLYICQTLCEKHGGSLKLANADGGGALVTSTFIW